MRNVHYFGMEDGINGMTDGAVDFSVDDVIGKDQEALDENNAALERLSVIQAGLEAGLPFDMSSLASELGIRSGLNRAMESFYMGDAPKKTMTIALEEVGVVQVGLIAAGIGVLAVIMKKIYEWLKNFFSSSSGGGGGGGSSGSETINAVAEAAKPLKELKQEIPKLPAVVKETLAVVVSSDSPEAEKAKEGQGGLVTVHDFMAKPEEHVSNGVEIPKHQPSKADEAGVHIPTGDQSQTTKQIDEFYAEFKKKINSKRVIFISKSSRGTHGLTNEAAVKHIEEAAKIILERVYPQLQEFHKLAGENGLLKPLELLLGTNATATDEQKQKSFDLAKKAMEFSQSTLNFNNAFKETVEEFKQHMASVPIGERPTDPVVYLNNILRLAEAFVTINKIKNMEFVSDMVRSSLTYRTMLEETDKTIKALPADTSEEVRAKFKYVKEILEHLVHSFREVGVILGTLWKEGQHICRCIVGLTYELRDVINQTTSRTTLTETEVECLKKIGHELKLLQVLLQNKESIKNLKNGK